MPQSPLCLSKADSTTLQGHPQNKGLQGEARVSVVVRQAQRIFSTNSQLNNLILLYFL